MTKKRQVYLFNGITYSQMMKKLLSPSSLIWLLLLGASCQVQEHEEIKPMQKEVRATAYTSLAQEPALTAVIAAIVVQSLLLYREFPVLQEYRSQN